MLEGETGGLSINYNELKSSEVSSGISKLNWSVPHY